MKYFFIILFSSFGFYNIAFTQSEDDILKNEWTANINFFVNDLILSKSKGDNVIDYQPPVESIVTYRRYFNKKIAWQIGVNYYKNESSEDFVLGLGGIQSQEKKGYFLRSGIQKYYHFPLNVKFYIGTDLMLSLQKYKAFIDFQDSPFPNQDNYNHVNQEKEIGLVSFLGFRWDLNSRISFSTEASLIGSYIFFDIDVDGPFSSAPILVARNNTLREDSESFNLRFQQPIVLLFNLRF